MMLKTSLFLLLTMCLLAACDQQQIYSKFYLMTHPAMLQKTIQTCHKMQVMAQSFSEQCRIANEANIEMANLVDEQQKNPQAFGQRILEAEMQYGVKADNGDEIKILLAVVGLSSPE